MIGIVADIVGLHNVKPLCAKLNGVINTGMNAGYDTFLFNMQTYAERYLAYHVKADVLKLSTPNINEEDPTYIIYVYDEKTVHLNNIKPTNMCLLVNLKEKRWHELT